VYYDPATGAFEKRPLNAERPANAALILLPSFVYTFKTRPGALNVSGHYALRLQP
jgi:hypothetical protein